MITWYRSTLNSRASVLTSYPKGNLVTRKSTNKSSSAEKYARDCFIIQSFISGDSSEIMEVFSKGKSPSEVQDNDHGPTMGLSIDLCKTVQTLLKRVTALEKAKETYQEREKYC